MDGTLADTERLKARAYADVIAELLKLDEHDPRLLPIYGAYAGNTDRALRAAMVGDIVTEDLRKDNAREPR